MPFIMRFKSRLQIRITGIISRGSIKGVVKRTPMHHITRSILAIDQWGENKNWGNYTKFWPLCWPLY